MRVGTEAPRVRERSKAGVGWKPGARSGAGLGAGAAAGGFESDAREGKARAETAEDVVDAEFKEVKRDA